METGACCVMTSFNRIGATWAGGDGCDCNDAGKWSAKLENYKDDPRVVSAMREATRHILYTVANSNVMNGMGFATTIVETRGWWQDAIIIADVVFGALAVLFLVLSILSGRKAKKKAAASRQQ